jgi:hypothetical protein
MSQLMTMRPSGREAIASRNLASTSTGRVLPLVARLPDAFKILQQGRAARCSLV